MDTPKLRPGCNTEINSVPHDVNDNGVDEDAARYMANPKARFWATISKIFRKTKEKDNV